MSRPNLVHPDQPAPVRMLLHVFQFLGSLKLAVVVIFTSAFFYGVGTFVEARFGTPVAQFGVYQTWWFNLSTALLATNIFFAAAIRYPWKRHQTGFVITHIGLLTLLFGTALSRWFGIDAQVLVWEHESSGWALKDDSMHVAITVHKDELLSDEDIRRIPQDVDNDEHLQRMRPVRFRPGAFSWRDYDERFWLTAQVDDEASDAPWWKSWEHLYPFRYTSGKMFEIARLGGPGPGDVLYNQNGIKLEVLDYLADSKRVSAPMVKIALSRPRVDRMNANGKPVKSRYHWTMQEVSINQLQRDSDEFPLGVHIRKTLFPGGTVAFVMADDQRRKDAFLENHPEGELGEKGQVVLFIDGAPRRFNVDDKLDAGKFPLEGTGWEIEIKNYLPAGQLGFDEEQNRYEVNALAGAEGSINPAVEIALYKSGSEEQADRLVLFADQPNLAIQSHTHHVYGDYWFDHKEKDRNQRMQHGIGNRIDILQLETADTDDPDAEEFQLYFRRWDKTSVVASGTIDVSTGEFTDKGMPEDALDAFTMSDQLKFYIEEYVPAAKAQTVTVPIEFEKAKNLGQRQPAVKMRLTMDDTVEEFWLEAYKDDPDFAPSNEAQHKIVEGKNRRVAVTLPIDAVDIGYRVRLLDFERRLDPGTSQASHYSSMVDILARNYDRKIMWSNLDGSATEQIEFPLVLEHDEIFSASMAQVSDDGKHLYWIADKRDLIRRIELNNDDARPENIVGGPHVPVEPIAFAIDGDLLYWVESIRSRSGEQARVRRANLDGSDEKTLAAFTGTPTGLTVDPEAEFVYWSYRKPTSRGDKKSGSIGRVHYDGEQQQDDLLGDDEGKYGVPSSLAVDPRGKRIYWTEPERGLIRSSDLEGGDVRKLSLQGQQQPGSIAVDVPNMRLYWSDLRDSPKLDEVPIEKVAELTERHRLWSADLTGENAQVIADHRIDNPAGMQVSSTGERLIWTQEAILKHKVWITMNAPVEFSNPRNGQSYRLFQESFNGPFEPGTRIYNQVVPAGVDADELYLSVLTVNYDPGRFVRSLGCLFIVCGITTMFYMRAYFFRRTPSRESRPNRAPPIRENIQTAPTSGRKRKQKEPAEAIDAKVVS